jgi:hypothetical protein
MHQVLWALNEINVAYRLFNTAKFYVIHVHINFI